VDRLPRERNRLVAGTVALNQRLAEDSFRTCRSGVRHRMSPAGIPTKVDLRVCHVTGARVQILRRLRGTRAVLL